MNKKGQSLVTFILFLPIIVFFLAFFVDTSLMYLEKNHARGIIRDNMEIILKKNIRDEEKIRNVIQKNDKNLNVTVKIDNDELNVYLQDKKKNLFGNLLDLEIYKIEFNYCANYLDKEIKECK